MTWFFNGESYNPSSDAFGFVYIITEKPTGKMYIGKKRLFKKIKRKGKNVLVDSDWRDYYGSSRKLLENLEKIGKENYHREVIKECTNAASLAYIELKEQIERKVLFDDNFYNEYIGGRLNAKGLQHLREEELK